MAGHSANDEPLRHKWAPSEWGPDDKAGAANRRTPASVLKAAKLVKKGKVATLGKVYQQDAPGFGISACEYLAKRKVALVGADVWAVEAVPGESEQPFECHIKMQTKRGIWFLENMDLSQLVADKAYEFLFAWSPLKMKGATGSPGNPVAVY